MIPVEPQQIDSIIEKIDHKQNEYITWEEYYQFLKYEGERREQVNSAQLYGLSTKRLKLEPKRHKLDLSTIALVEYYVESMILIKNKHMRLTLIMMENNTAKLFDLKTMEKLDDLTFPAQSHACHLATKEVKKEKSASMFDKRSALNSSYQTLKPLAPNMGMIKKFSTKELVVIQEEKELAENKNNDTFFMEEFSQRGDSQNCQSMIEPTPQFMDIRNAKHRNNTSIPKEVRSSRNTLLTHKKENNDPYSNNKRAVSQSGGGRMTRCQKSILGKRHVSQKQLYRAQTAMTVDADRDKDVRSEEESKVRASGKITAWRTSEFHLKQVNFEKERIAKEEAEREAKIALTKWAAGGTNKSSTQQMEQNTKADSDPYQLTQGKSNSQQPFTLAQIKPGLAAEQKNNEKQWNKKKEQIKQILKDHDRRMEKKFIKMLKSELSQVQKEEGREANNFERISIVNRIMQELGFISKEELEKQEHAAVNRYNQLLDTQKACNLKFGSIQKYMDSAQTEVNKVLRQNRAVTKNLKAFTELFLGKVYAPLSDSEEESGDEEKKKVPEKGGDPLPSRFFRYNKRQQQRNKSISVDAFIEKQDLLNEKVHDKKAHVMNTCYSEEFGLLAISLIDREVKIYYIKQNGPKVKLMEHCSFYCSKHIISEMHFERYIATRKIILCCGTQEGKIYIYEIDWDEKDPNYAKQQQNDKEYRKNCKPPLPPKKYHKLLLPPFDFMQRNPTMKKIKELAHVQKDQECETEQKSITHNNHRFSMLQQAPSDFNSRRFSSQDAMHSGSERNDKQQEEDFFKPQVKVNESGIVKSTLMNPNKLIQNNYWNLMVKARDKRIGPDGITIWNEVQKVMTKNKKKAPVQLQLMYQDFDRQVVSLSEALYNMEIKSLDVVPNACEKWMVCLRLTQGDIDHSQQKFKEEMEVVVQDSNTKFAEEGKMQLAIKRYFKVNPDITETLKQSAKKDGSKRNMSETKRQHFAPDFSASTSDLNMSKFKTMIMTKQQSNMQSSVGKTKFNVSSDSDKDSDNSQPAKNDNDSDMEEENGPKDTRMREITGIRYFKDIGLIVTTFEGSIKIMDNCSFKTQWQNTNKERKVEYHSTISSFDVSQQLGLMVTGGDLGKILLVDPYGQGLLTWKQVVSNDSICKVFIYELQQQIICITEDRTIVILNAYTLERIQIIKDINTMHSTKYTYAAFDQEMGTIWTSCQRLTEWQYGVDNQVEVQALQTSTLMKHMLEERKMHDLVRLANRYSKTMIPTISYKKTENVLMQAGKQSQLVDVLACTNPDRNDIYRIFITIDSKNLVRQWSIKQQTVNIYKLRIKGRITAAAIDPDQKYLAVGSEKGEADILNIRSGGVVFDLPNVGREITCLVFMKVQSDIWLAGGSFGGKVILWTEPSVANNHTMSVTARVGHFADIVSIDCNNQFICTGGADGNLTIWNVLAGTMKFAVQMPKPGKVEIDDREVYVTKGGNSIRKSVVGVLFHPVFSNLVLALTEGGEIHAIDTMLGAVTHERIATVKVNSNWAIDPNTMKLFVVGDVGRAVMFDARMGCDKLEKGCCRRIYAKSSANERLPVAKQWFWAHEISKININYVIVVKFLETECLFLSATSQGEVKFWSAEDCDSYGTMNSANWDEKRLKEYIRATGKKLRQQGLAQVTKRGAIAKTKVSSTFDFNNFEQDKEEPILEEGSIEQI